MGRNARAGFVLRVCLWSLIGALVLPARSMASNCSAYPWSSYAQGDANLDGVTNCDDAAILLPLFAGPGYDERADLNCDGVVNLSDQTLFQSKMAACGCEKITTINCSGGALTATPSTLTVGPGDWVRFAPSVNCSACGAGSYAVITMATAGLFPNGWSYRAGSKPFCSEKIPVTATAGTYKFTVTLYQANGVICTSVAPNPLDPYIIVQATPSVPMLGAYGTFVLAALLCAVAAFWLYRRRLAA